MIDKERTRFIAVLFFIYTASIVDEPNILISTFKLKIFYIVAFIFVLYYCAFSGYYNKKSAFYSLTFILCLIPSLISSTNLAGSIAFFLGILVLMGTALVAERIASVIEAKTTVRFFVSYYRVAILLAAGIYLFGLQERARLLFYEPSYFAIALIPYISIVVINFFTSRTKSWLDLFLLFIAVVITSSASLIAWIFFSIVLAWLKYSKRNLICSAFASMLVCVCFFLLVNFNDRAALAFEYLNDRNIFGFLVHVGGNRLQRVLVGYDVFTNFPLSGVGMNSMASYVSSNFNCQEYYLDGLTASDFDLNEVSNAVNAYIELAAETGFVGILGFITYISRIFTSKGFSIEYYSIYFAVIITSLALFVESSYLRPYVWILYGLLLGISNRESRSHKDCVTVRVL